MFADANTIVMNSDQPGDLACDHALRRSGNIIQLHGTGSDGDIDSLEELLYVWGGPGFVKIVPLISYCERMEPGIAGCSPLGPGVNTLTLAEWAAKDNIRGLALAHEYGHVVGLAHDPSTIGNLMQPAASLDNRGVTEAQCRALRTDVLDTHGPIVTGAFRSPQRQAGYALVNGSTPVSYAELDQLSILQLAHSLFFQRTPIEVEDAFGEADLNILLDLLSREEERDYHPTIAMLIGLLGGRYGDLAADALVSYIDTHSGTAASRIALSSLGHLAAQGNNYALDTLIVNATPSAFYGPAAVVGLGVSGRVEARNVLQGLEASSQDLASHAATYGPVASGLHRSTILEAVSVNETIASAGRRGYYQD
jgi:hypothetical protein